MHTHTLILLFFGLLSGLCANAQQLDKLTQKQLLEELDDVIEHKLEYRALYVAQIDSMKHCANSQPVAMRPATYEKIFKAYLSLQGDSALAYLDRMQALPAAAEDRDFADKITIGRAHAFGVMGLYSSALRLLRAVDVADNSAEVVLYYYQTCRTVYGWMADFGEMSGQDGYYTDLTQRYRDSILAVQPKNINRSIIEADDCFVKGDHKRAMEICQLQYASANDLQRCYLCFNMAQAADGLGRTDDEIRYLAMSAIYDLKRGITEYSALQKLAVLLSQLGDTERAYKYLICTLEDSTYGKARLRSFEASEVFPIIERAHAKTLRDHRVRSIQIAVILFVLFISVCLGLIYSRRRNRMLHSVRNELNQAISSLKEVNEALLRANETLVDSNKAKETCLARYLERCRVYIDTIDSQRKASLRLLKSRKFEELAAELRSNAMITQEEESFYADFDEAFVTIFPNFVRNFNALLQPECQIVPKHEEMLNTELRIFALIRLGIADSNRIAHFLNYSLPTIYSYRSRIRNKSIYSKEEFDAKVMEC